MPILPISGLSSLYSLFDEHGPVYMDMKVYITRKRKLSWTNKYNVLYLDPHIDGGFSFGNSNGLNTSIEEISTRICLALQQFFRVFSKYRTRDVYLAGGHDASKFITTISYVNLAKKDPETRINIKGLLIGNENKIKI